MYLLHIFRSIIIKYYRSLCVKHELREQYDGIAYDWKKVAKDYNNLKDK